MSTIHWGGALFIFVRMRKEDYKKNAPNWTATPDDYRLVFRLVDGMWREVTNNLACYADMLLADYLQEMDIVVPEHCRSLNIRYVDEHNYDVKIWYRCYADNGTVAIDFDRKKCEFKY